MSPEPVFDRGREYRERLAEAARGRPWGHREELERAWLARAEDGFVRGPTTAEVIVAVLFGIALAPLPASLVGALAFYVLPAAVGALSPALAAFATAFGTVAAVLAWLRLPRGQRPLGAVRVTVFQRGRRVEPITWIAIGLIEVALGLLAVFHR